MVRSFLLISLTFVLAACAACAASPEDLSTPLPSEPPAISPDALPTQTMGAESVAASPNIDITPSTPALPLSETSQPAGDAGWDTFASDEFGVILDYPSGWTVSESAGDVMINSPQGLTLQMAEIDTGGLTIESYWHSNQLPNTRCETITNQHGLEVRTCLHTLSKSLSAQFILPTADGSSRLVSLSARGRVDPQVFAVIVDSLRLKQETPA